MSILGYLKHAVSRALDRVAAPEEPDVAMAKLLEYKAASPCRNRSGSAKPVNKTKNRAKAKAAKAARKASRK